MPTAAGSRTYIQCTTNGALFALASAQVQAHSGQLPSVQKCVSASTEHLLARHIHGFHASAMRTVTASTAGSETATPGC